MPRVVEVLNRLRKQAIKSPRAVEPPHLVVEVTAGGPFLIRDGEFRDSLKELPLTPTIKVASPVHPKLVSAEMESHGFMNAAHEQGIRACVLKGISDDGDPKKRELEKKTGGYYRAYACTNALLALFHALQRPPRLTRPADMQSETIDEGKNGNSGAAPGSMGFASGEAASITLSAQTVLDAHRARISRLPGVVGVGVKEAIVVFLEQGSTNNLPATISGVRVIVREVPPIRMASYASKRWTTGLAKVFLGERAGGLGAIVVGGDGNRYLMTASHVIQPHLKGGESIHVLFEGGLHEAQLLDCDQSVDIALLRSNALRPAESASEVVRTLEAVAPSVGQTVRISSTGGMITGVVSLIDGSVTLHSALESGDSVVHVDGVFMVRTATPLTPGQSGAMVSTVEGTPVGLVVGITRAEDRSTLVIASVIQEFLKERKLQVEVANDATVVAVMVTHYVQLRAILDHLEGPIHFEGRSGFGYWRGHIRGNPRLTVVVCELAALGSVSGAMAAMELVRRVSPDVLLGVGLASGDPIKTHPGDVVISDGVLFITPEHKGGGTEPEIQRLSVHPKAMAAAQIAAMATGGTDAKKPDGSAGGFAVHIGPIASVDKVLPNLSKLNARFLAVEMEGAGMSAAAQQFGIPCLLIRGIADVIGEKKEDVWRGYAASAAVTTTMVIIRTLGLERLREYDWHESNIRDLENVIGTAADLTDGPIVCRRHIEEAINEVLVDFPTGTMSGEQKMIQDALRGGKGNKAAAAKIIGWTRQKLYRTMKKYDIPPDYGRRE